MAETLADHDRNLHKMPKSYQRMVRAAREETEAEPLELISRGGFKPVLEWSSMANKSKLITRIEQIDAILSILQEIRASEMAELEKVEAQEK
jgi:hypothetical protein